MIHKMIKACSNGSCGSQKKMVLLSWGLEEIPKGDDNLIRCNILIPAPHVGEGGRVAFEKAYAELWQSVMFEEWKLLLHDDSGT